MLTNVHAMVMAITSIKTQIWVDQPIPMNRWCLAALAHSKKTEVAASGCLQHGWFPDEVHTDAMLVHLLLPKHAFITLHNQPVITVFSKMLFGSVHLMSYA